MKTTKTLVLVLLVMALVLFIAACKKAPAPPVVENTTNVAPAETLPAQTPEEIEMTKFKEDQIKAIDANDKVIADYKAKMTDATGKLMAKYDKKIDALEVKNKEIRTKLEEFTYTDKVAWDKFKMDFDKSIKDLGLALKKYEPKL